MTEADEIEFLVEQSMPWLFLLLLALAACVVGVVALELGLWLRGRSPVERILRRRFG
jgi:hypothetical protein